MRGDDRRLSVTKVPDIYTANPEKSGTVRMDKTKAGNRKRTVFRIEDLRLKIQDSVCLQLGD